MQYILLAGLVLGIQKRPARIVGGHEVQPPFRYPWMVSLQQYGVHLCGGTLYNARTVVTAAHCTIGKREKWAAHLHRHNLDRRVAEEDGLVFPILKQINHPSYDSAFTKRYDVSVWKVNAIPVTPIALGTDRALFPDNLITVIGWGRVAETAKDSEVLLQAQLPFYNQTHCKLLYSNLNMESQFCAGFPSGIRDSCQGDSGGPAFVAEKNRYALVGVVSWGRGCAKKNRPGVYTRIHMVKQFILDNSY